MLLLISAILNYPLRNFVLLYFILFLSIFVYIVDAILHEAYISLNVSVRGQMITLFFLGALNLAIACISLTKSGLFLSDVLLLCASLVLLFHNLAMNEHGDPDA